MLVIDMIRQRHLVRVNSLLNTELRHDYVECAVENTYDPGGTDDGPESLREIVD